MEIPSEVKKIRTKCKLKPYKYPAHAALRRFIYERDDFTCQCCGKRYAPPAGYDGCKSIKDLELDHIIPLSRGGLGCVENLQTLCSSCNSRKGDKIKEASKHGLA